DCPGTCSGGANAGHRCIDGSECPGGTCGGNGACGPTTCVAGTNAGNPCTSDAGCPGGQCGPVLFDFAPFGTAGVGPLVLPRLRTGVGQGNLTMACRVSGDWGGWGPCVVYAFSAETPVPLEGLIQTPDTFAFVVDEPILGNDLNGDGDHADTVVTL